MLWQAFGRWGGIAGTTPGGAGSDPYWANVKLLLGMEGADGSTTFTDESPVARGNALAVEGSQVDTAQAKYGSGSLLLDGTLDYISYTDSADWNFTSSDQWTVECWVRFNVLTGFRTFMSQWHAPSDQSWLFDFTGSATNLLRFAYSTTGANTVAVQGSWAPSANTWYHVAADCDGTNKLRIYVDGVMKASATSVPSFFNSTFNLRIGAIRDTGGTSNELNGWIDEVRITKGVARYASDGGYSVPTAAFPRS